MPVLQVDDLAMRFGERPVLENLALRVERGELVALRGANAAGKSTLLRLCAGLLLPRVGRVRVAGRSPDAARRRSWIGWSDGGERSFIRRLSLCSNLLLCTRLAGYGDRVGRARIAEQAELLEFESHLEVSAERCSTGLRQRAALARALITGSKLLLLDEPLRGVDAESSLRLALRVRQWARDRAVLWVSHRPDEVAAVGDRSLRLECGRLVSAPRVRAA